MPGNRPANNTERDHAMKALFLLPALFAATQFLPPAAAQSEAQTRDAEIIKRYDTNKDGKLDDAEIAAVKEKVFMEGQQKQEDRRDRVRERQEKLVAEFDKNGDGKLDDTERAVMEIEYRARVEKRPRLLERFDTNKDGKLDDAEWTAAKEKIIDRLQEEPRGKKNAKPAAAK